MVDDFDVFHKKNVGASGGRSAYLGFCRYASHKFKKGFVDSGKSRLKFGLTVGLFAFVLGYLPNREKVDASIDEFHGSMKEYFDGARLKYDNNVLSSEVSRAESQLSDLQSEKLALESRLGEFEDEFLSESRKYASFADSLSGVVSSINKKKVALESEVNNIKKNFVSSKDYSRVVDSLNDRVSYLDERLAKSEELVLEYARSEAKSGSDESSGSFFAKIKDFIFNSSSSNRSISTKKDSGDAGSTYWVAMPPGQSLSAVAEMYYGDPHKFKLLAEINDLSDPNFVLRKQPIKLLREDMEHYKGVFQGDVPLFEQVHTYETLDGFIERNNIFVSSDRIIKYNVDRGNNISKGRRLLLDTDVVYLRDEWVR